MSAHKNALRYCYLSTLADWSEIEQLLRSSTAESASEQKEDLDRLIDKRIEELGAAHREAVIDALTS